MGVISDWEIEIQEAIEIQENEDEYAEALDVYQVGGRDEYLKYCELYGVNPMNQTEMK
jgi:hypothetical protein